MKIAILTLPLHTNYGGILQAYALQTTLERMGHEIEMLQRPSASNAHSLWLMPLIYSKRALYKLLIDRRAEIFVEQKHKKERPIIERNTSQFINRYIHLRPVKTLSEISLNDYDAIVVGSDQVWRKKYFKSSWYAPISYAFLSFTKNWDIVRIAYAASFGTDNMTEYTEKEIRKCQNAIKQFDAISVREDSGVAICHDVFGVDALQLIDPTLLLCKEDYIRLVKQSNVLQSSGNLMCYILDRTPFKAQIISQISSLKGLTPFAVNADVNNLSLSVDQRIQPHVESFIRGFMDADFIITDSFHACVFSIIFNKPFIAVANSGRGLSRFTSLLETFNLTNRLIDENTKELTILEINTWDHVNRILTDQREVAHKFLINALS